MWRIKWSEKKLSLVFTNRCVSVPVCSETRSTTVQRPRSCHCRDINRAAMPWERGIPRFSVPLVSQQRGAPSRPQKQPEAGQLIIQHQSWHWRPGKKDGKSPVISLSQMFRVWKRLLSIMLLHDSLSDVNVNSLIWIKPQIYGWIKPCV